ncbi:MAG TPA: alpha-ketoglutarate-dependent dioxygenase AlkB [Sphingomicrobium sp.]|jgi:alkylated DNA repair dioxygenase AlkB|nr:alpha-ketoglutarate-dependent dioxygenase AlkB [Sphingomicrobium sp.]
MKLLFDAPLICGLTYREEMIDKAEEETLIGHLEAMDLPPFRFHGWLGNRKTKSFGWRYDFDDSSFSKAEDIPGWLEPLRETAAAFADLDPECFVQVLLARYDPGAGIGWHRDRDVFDQVVGVSLATSTTLRFRRRRPDGFDRTSLELAPRSAYLLSGEARWEFEHSIAPGDALRFSITFRKLSDKGSRIALAKSERSTRAAELPASS